MEIERRRFPRFSTSIPVGIRFPVGPYKDGWGRTVDVSAEGLLLETRFPIKVADVIYVTFTLYDGAYFENLRARVVRTSYQEGYYLVGIAFDDVVDKQTMRDVLAALAVESRVSLS